MNRFAGRIAAGLIAVMLSLAGPFSGAGALAAAPASQFFGSDPTAIRIMEGAATYDMNDPAWLVSVNGQNRDTFAYKLFSALFMLGYQTEISYNYASSWMTPHRLSLHAFQAKNGLPVSDTVTAECLAGMDQQLLLREQALAPAAQGFSLYGRMQPLHGNDISRDALAVIYALPMAVLPSYLRMSTHELVQCIAGQCNGFIQDAGGAGLSSWPTPIDLATDYRFVGAYFDRLRSNTRLPSAAVHVDTVLHEYAHYLDGWFAWSKQDPLQTHIGLIDTRGFHDISYDMASGTYCYTMRSSDPRDWITRYGFVSQSNQCAAGTSTVFEEWAEAFSMYVSAGRDFRAAALQSGFIAQKYAWLKENVFGGLEYDTNLPRGLESGCNDVYGTQSALPGYAHCSDGYVWDFTLPAVPSAPDAVPDAFAFTPRTGVAPATAVISNAVIVMGITSPAAVSIAGGEYSINGGGFTAQAGEVNFRDSVRVRLTSPGSPLATASATLTIGGMGALFSVTTIADPSPPTISGSPPPGGTVGTPYSFTPTAEHALSFTITGALPPGLAFDPVTGALSGTPTVKGDYGSFCITAVGYGGATAQLPAFSIAIAGRKPVIWAYPVAEATVGLPYAGFDVWSQYAAGFTLSGPVPPGMAFDSATGALSGTPTARGFYDGIVITATNGDGSASLAPFSITVRLPRPTISGHPAAIGMVGIPFAAFAPATSGAAGLTLSGALPPGIEFDPQTGALSGTPTAAGSYPGIVITASNADGSTSLPAFGIEISRRIDTFTAGAPLTTARQYHTATRLENGSVLVAGGVDTGYGALSGAERYDPAAGAWRQGGGMAEARSGHSATLLADGRVLVVGYGSAELYDPALDAWRTVPATAGNRIGHTATLLSDGRVLVAGGVDIDWGELPSCELFDPATESWTAAGPMGEARSSHTATLLSNGAVLAVGGMAGGSAELYDPAADAWRPAAAMDQPRANHAATLLSDGSVLVSGGHDVLNRDLSGAELYDPGLDRWGAAGSMVIARQSHIATVLPDGAVLVTGGWGEANGGVLAFAELYDPATRSWRLAGVTVSPRTGHTATGLPGGAVLITGGSDGGHPLAATEIYSSPRLTATKRGQGSVAPDRGAMNWAGATGTASYPPGTVVTLTAEGAAGYRFAGWSGDCGGTLNSCLVTMDQNRAAEARFALLGDVSPDEALTVADAILALQILSGLSPSAAGQKQADVDGDGRIGMAEAIFVLQTIAETR